MGGHHLCGLFVLQPSGEQQNLAVHRGNVDVKDLIAILQLEEVAPARIRLLALRRPANGEASQRLPGHDAEGPQYLAADSTAESSFLAFLCFYLK